MVGFSRYGSPESAVGSGIAADIRSWPKAAIKRRGQTPFLYELLVVYDDTSKTGSGPFFIPP
jgi:hypothetical protein